MRYVGSERERVRGRRERDIKEGVYGGWKGGRREAIRFHASIWLGAHVTWNLVA